MRELQRMALAVAMAVCKRQGAGEVAMMSCVQVGVIDSC